MALQERLHRDGSSGVWITAAQAGTATAFE